MASAPPSATQLMTLGMFVFGMDTIAYGDLQRRMTWRHEEAERFGARPAAQFAGPGDDTVSIAGLIVPEVAGTYAAIDVLVAMAGTGDSWPLMDGMGRVLGNYRIEGIDQTHRSVMAGGIPRAIDFSIDLKRVD